MSTSYWFGKNTKSFVTLLRITVSVKLLVNSNNNQTSRYPISTKLAFIIIIDLVEIQIKIVIHWYRRYLLGNGNCSYK